MYLLHQNITNWGGMVRIFLLTQQEFSLQWFKNEKVKSAECFVYFLPGFCSHIQTLIRGSLCFRLPNILSIEIYINIIFCP